MSSAAAHVGETDATGLLDLKTWRRRYTPAQWRRIVADPLDETTLAQLRTGIRRGRPLGSDAFIAKLEALLNRRLRAAPRGRPRKKAKKKV